MFNKNRSTDAVFHQLQAAALAAITTFGDGGGREAVADSNPYTARLTPYDLGRMFNYSVGKRDAAVSSLDAVYVIISRTSTSSRDDALEARARWVATELDRIGAREQAERFTALADESSDFRLTHEAE